MTATPLVLVPLALYMLVLIGLGLLGRKKSQSLDGFFVAGKKLPSWVIAFSANATGESGWLLLGLTGMGYAVGMHALWVVLGEALGVALAWTIVARRFKAYTDRYGSITVPDYLEDRFADRARLLRSVSVVIILTMVATYCCAQLVASGKAFSSFLGVSYGAGVLIGLVVTVAYTAVGGFSAVAWSDLVQGVLMALGLLILPIVGIHAAGGFEATMQTLHTIDPSLLLAMGSDGLSAKGIASAASFAFIGLAFLGVPQLLVRFISARNDRQIVEGGAIAVICILIFDFGAVFAGMAGRALFPGIADPETVMPLMADELFPAIFTGIFSGHRARRDHVNGRLVAHPGVFGRGSRSRAEDLQELGRRCAARALGKAGECGDRAGGASVCVGAAQGALLVRSLCLVGLGCGVSATGAAFLVVASSDESGRSGRHGGWVPHHGVVGLGS